MSLWWLKNVRGTDILKDWCEGCAISHHFDVIVCFVHQYSEADYLVNRSFMSFNEELSASQSRRLSRRLSDVYNDIIYHMIVVEIFFI